MITGIIVIVCCFILLCATIVISAGFAVIIMPPPTYKIFEYKLDKDGNLQEPPLVALSLEESRQLYEKENNTNYEVEFECKTGLCGI